MNTRTRSTSAVALLFLALTVVLTWPQVTHLSWVPEHPDSWFNMWRLAWFHHALSTAPLNLFDANIYAPATDTFAYSDAMPVVGLIAMPLIAAGLPVPVAYNVLVLASFLFAAGGAFALVSYLTGRASAATVAGVIFAFTSYRFDHYFHLELLWTGWMPLALLAQQKAFDTGRARWGVAAGLMLALQTLSSIYYGVFLAVVMAVLGIAALVVGRGTVRLRTLAGLAGGALLVGVFAIPYMQPYHRAKEVVGERNVAEAGLYSAGPRHYFSTVPESWMYGSLVDGRHEKRLFPGGLAIGLAAIGLWPPLGRRLWPYIVGLLVAVNLSLGVNGIGYQFLVDHTSVFRGLRAPARAASLSLLFVAVLAGFGVARIESWLARSRATVRKLFLPATVTVMAIEYAVMPLVLVPAPPASDVSRWLATQPAGIVADLPLPSFNFPGRDAKVEYQSIFHWQPIVNGASGNVPPHYMELVHALDAFPSATGLEALRRLPVRFVVVHERHYGSARYDAIRAFLQTQTNVVVRREFSDAGFGVVVYELLE